MQTEQAPQPIDYAKAIALLVAKMPLERAAQVYDFVRFLQGQTTPASPPTPIDEDWLNDTEEAMQAEDELWAAIQTRERDKFSALAAAARAEIDAGATEPMFRADGELALP